ncbi:MAG: hypothetical protein WCL50_05370 [Spirochaetota bacterium]
MQWISRAGLCFLTLSLLAGFATRAEITVSVIPPSPGGWLVSVGANTLAGGAGTDFTHDYSTGPGGETINIAGTASASEAWQVLVKRSDTSWDGDLVVQVQVLSLGTGNGTVYAPGQAMTVSDTFQSFFTGNGDRSTICVRLKLSGVSIPRVRAGRYTTNLVYTVVPLQ